MTAQLSLSTPSQPVRSIFIEPLVMPKNSSIKAHEQFQKAVERREHFQPHMKSWIISPMDKQLHKVESKMDLKSFLEEKSQ